MPLSFQLSPGPLRSSIADHQAAAERASVGVWHGDPATWSADAAVQRKISDRLGWLSSPELMAASVDRLQTFASRVRSDGFADVVLLGMGGSSLAPEVLRAIIGVQPGWPRFHMLDSTDPAAVLSIDADPKTTLYLLASKSGTTIEPSSLAAHFRERLGERGVEHWAGHFAAITDEGTELARQARIDQFRDVFINPSDIGGRYSALSFFGLVPAALMGQNIKAIIGWGQQMLKAADPERGSVTTNPACGLGLAMGAAARSGRDKLTLLLPPALEPFGLWVEQLVAESTGKQGTGVVPIAGEAPGELSAYGADRFFVALNAAGDNGNLVHMIEAGGAPIGWMTLPEPEALGAEFVRWEIATAVAGAILGINPFDEPNVQQAKDATRALLEQYKSAGALPMPQPARTLDTGVSLTLTQAAQKRTSPEGLLTLVGPGDYVGLLAYLGPDPALAQALTRFRTSVRNRKKAATMFAYGPRYLHSTGQLHKGGPNTGVFVLVSAVARQDVPIPSQPFSFGTLELAQALGDFSSLDATGRRAVHIHLPAPDAGLLEDVLNLLLGSG